MKVRVWHKTLKKFLPKEEWFLNFDGELFFMECVDWNDVLTKADTGLYVIQQHVGVKDDNGIDLCEGDILKDIYCDDPDLYVCKNGETHVGDKLAFFRIKGGNIEEECYDYYGGLYLDDKIIIGNIFENPELLND